MTAWEALPWVGWLLTAGGVAYRTWCPPVAAVPPVEPVTDGWHQVVMNERGEVESTRRVRDGSAPTRLERAHGRAHVWYRLTHVDGLSLIYKPEPRTK